MLCPGFYLWISLKITFYELFSLFPVHIHSFCQGQDGNAVYDPELAVLALTLNGAMLQYWFYTLGCRGSVNVITA